MSFDPSALPPPAQKALAPDAPAPMKMLAARGVIPGCPPHVVLYVLVRLALEATGDVQSTARTTIDKLPPPLLEGALSQDLPEQVLDALVEPFGNDPAVLPKLLRMPSMTVDVLGRLCERATEVAGEIIATNEALLLKMSAVIEKLYMNKRVRMSTADRLIELAVRNGIELDFSAFKLAAEAIQNQLIPEPTEELNFDDQLFLETEHLAEHLALREDEDVCDKNEEGEETVNQKFAPLFAQIQNMTVTQKIRSAMLGNGAMRMLLVRDTNRLVSEAAAKSPRLTVSEAVQISASRAVSDDVLRIIANNRDLVRGYQVKLNLVTNPRTPFTFSSRLVPHLRDNDLRNLSRSKNVPGSIARAAKQQLSRKG